MNKVSKKSKYKELNPIKVIQNDGDDKNINNHIIVNIRNQQIYIKNHYDLRTDKEIEDFEKKFNTKEPKNTNDEIELMAFGMKEVFDNVYEIGKELYKHFKDVSYYNLVGNDYRYANNKMMKWIDVVGYIPYSKEHEDLTDLFTHDCIICYMFSEINKMLYKDINMKADGNIENHKKRVKKYLSAIKETLINSVYVASSDGFNKIDTNDYLSDLEMLEEIDLNKIFVKNKDNIDVLNKNISYLIRKCMIVYIYTLTNNLDENISHEYIVSKQTPIYNPDSKQFRIYYMSNSLMAIAYYQLLLNLTAGKSYWERKICHANDCFNEIEVFGNYKYCEEHRNTSKFRKKKLDENKKELQHELEELINNTKIIKNLNSDIIETAKELISLNKYQRNNTSIQAYRNVINMIKNRAN